MKQSRKQKIIVFVSALLLLTFFLFLVSAKSYDSEFQEEEEMSVSDICGEEPTKVKRCANCRYYHDTPPIGFFCTLSNTRWIIDKSSVCENYTPSN